MIFMFSSFVANSAITNAVGNVTAFGADVWDLGEFPTWNSTYANHQMELIPEFTIIPEFTLWNFTVNGGFFSGGADITWIAVIPEFTTPALVANDGIAVYLGDWFSALGNWLSDVINFFLWSGDLLFRLLTPPTEVNVILLTVLSIAYGVLYLMLAIGLSDYVIRLIGALIP